MKRLAAQRFLIGLMVAAPTVVVGGGVSAYTHGPTAVPKATGCTIIGSSGTTRTFTITWDKNEGKPIGGRFERTGTPNIMFNMPRKDTGTADYPIVNYSNTPDAEYFAGWTLVLDGRKTDSAPIACTPNT